MDYPQNLSESDRRWFDLIQEWRTSGKSDRQWLTAPHWGLTLERRNKHF